MRLACTFTFLTVLAGAAHADPVDPGEDFLAEGKLMFRVVACGGTDALPAELLKGDAARATKIQAVVDKHCKSLAPYMEKFKKAYFGDARDWLVKHEPANLPPQVVYPFGGGDLISALVAFPDATEITTLSLELAGDPRHLAGLSPEELDKALGAFRTEIGALIWVGSNSSINLSDGQRNALAEQLSSHLLGLTTGGYELVGMRYFGLDDKGEIHYLTHAEIDADTKDGKSLRGNWKSPKFAQSFANVELKFKRPGDATIRTHRHIAWNLGNEYLKTHGEVLKHLEAKGKITMMTKGASYLLWLGDFSTIRQYLLDHLVWMLSDSTGIPPNLATGMQQETYGNFNAPIIDKVEDKPADLATRALWRKANKGGLPFRFGYLDKFGSKHLLITRPKS